MRVSFAKELNGSCARHADVGLAGE